MVLIIIGILKGLDHVKNELEKRGYEVVYVEDYSYPIDAIIYQGSSFQMSYISRNNMPIVNAGVRPNYGVLIINYKGQSVEEIENTLKKRCYSPLF